MLQIYNTLTRKKEVFEPINPGKVSIYLCGITVYDYCHVGHARAYIAFDVIIRYLKFRGFEVNFVRNITDIDDKIIKRAQENAESTFELTKRFISAMHEDFAALRLLEPDLEPKATEFMPQMIELISSLEQKDYAYKAENGDVYYDVTKFANYGQLSNRNLDEMQAGSRVKINEAKKCPLDFVLWKSSKPGEPAWDSPWGKGRPGWHLECSAMAMHHLGETFDIHGGGIDLSFPHHENECAQSEAATGKKFVNTWMHAGFLQINQQKMSKSLGNFSTVREVLKEVHPETLRYFMLTGHYRSPLDYLPEQIELSKSGLERFYIALRGLPAATKAVGTEYEKRFFAAMDDDFNTPETLAVLFDLTREINKTKVNSIEQAASLGELLKELGGVLGLLQVGAEEFLHGTTKGEAVDANQIKVFIEQRALARSNRDWAEADRVREELDKLGIVLEDTAEGTIWRKK